jgi:hypothetical protein
MESVEPFPEHSNPKSTAGETAKAGRMPANELLNSPWIPEKYTWWKIERLAMCPLLKTEFALNTKKIVEPQRETMKSPLFSPVYQRVNLCKSRHKTRRKQSLLVTTDVPRGNQASARI